MTSFLRDFVKGECGQDIFGPTLLVVFVVLVVVAVLSGAGADLIWGSGGSGLAAARLAAG